jgi:hypothetical protein
VDPIIIFIVLAIVIIVAAFLYRQRGKFKLTGPFNTGVEFEGSNIEPPPAPGVKMEDIQSQSGSIIAEDNTGRGTHMSRADAWGDIRASSKPPEGQADPKA